MTWRTQLHHRGVVVPALGITQTLAWASSYYLTAVFTDPVSTDLHLSRLWFYGSVSAALLLSGLLGPVAGRMIDRYGGRDVLTVTNLLFAAGLVLLSFAAGPFGLVGAWLVTAGPSRHVAKHLKNQETYIHCGAEFGLGSEPNG